MTDKELVMLFGAIILILQIILAIVHFVYRIWDKKNTERIIQSINNSVKESVASFDPHIERAKKTHDWVYQLREQNSIKDQTGLPLIYRNIHLEDLQATSVNTLAKITDTLDYVSKLVEKLDIKIDSHKDDCKSQFGIVDKNIEKHIAEHIS